MKGNLIALGLKLFGFGNLWDKIDGMKTYLGASAEMLTGLSVMAGSAAGILNSFVSTTHSLGDAINFYQNNIAHPSTQAMAFTGAWLVVLHGWAAAAKKHADDKKHAELLAAAAAPALTNVSVPALPMIVPTPAPAAEPFVGPVLPPVEPPKN